MKRRIIFIVYSIAAAAIGASVEYLIVGHIGLPAILGRYLPITIVAIGVFEWHSYKRKKQVAEKK